MPGVGATRIPEVVRLRLGGATVTEIADALGVSKGAISDTIHSPEVEAQLTEANNDSYAAIGALRADLALEALRFKAHVMRGMPDERGVLTFAGTDAATVAVRDRAATEILDRCGVTKETAIRISGQTEHRVVVEFRGLANAEIDAEIAALELELAGDLPVIDITGDE